MPGHKCLDINKKHICFLINCDLGRSLALQTKQLGPEMTLRPRSHKTTVQTETTATRVDTATKVAKDYGAIKTAATKVAKDYGDCTATKVA